MNPSFYTVVIGHYPNDELASMQRFDARIIEQLQTTGGNQSQHESWHPPVVFGRIRRSAEGLGKWLGYLDKFLLFPLMIQFRILNKVRDPERTLFILPDHSHGIYLPLFRHWPHVVHVHDLIAIRMAQNSFFGQTLSLSGKIYQRWISKGLSNARQFICISQASKQDLMTYVSPKPILCRVVHNELNYPYGRAPADVSLQESNNPTISALPPSFLLHVGNRLWYKNREGVLRIFAHLLQATDTKFSPSLVVVGEPPIAAELELIAQYQLTERIHFLRNIENIDLALLYSRTIGLLFPSHYEGFGWPIIEALACGCPVLTTRRAPMTEVGGTVADYIEPMPISITEGALQPWLESAVQEIRRWLTEDTKTRKDQTENRINYSRQFAVGTAFRQYFSIYQCIVNPEPACVS